MTNVKDLIKLHEGSRNLMYKCTAGFNTIGIGHNLDTKPISDRAIDVIFEDDLAEFEESVIKNFPFYESLSEVRKAVILDMAFNLGIAGISKFKNFLAAVEMGDYITAGVEMLDSRWAAQVGQRSTRLSLMMTSDQWPSY